MAVNSFNAQNPPVTTKGDLFTFSTIPTRLGVGANNTVLTADSTTATGLKWETISAGGMTLLTTVTATAATSVSFTSIPTTYKHLLLTWEKVFQSSNNVWWGIRFNNDTTSNFHYINALTGISGGSSTTQALGTTFGTDTSNSPIPEGSTQALTEGRNTYGRMWIYDYADAGRGTGVNYETSSRQDSTANYVRVQAVGIYEGTSAVTRIDFIRNSTQTITGTFRLYGVS